MEGSGEDSEPQILAGIARDLQRSIQVSQSDLVNHLQENQETTRRGHAEISETLRKVSESQQLISQLLMEMTHKGKGPESYANRETVDLMVGTDISRNMCSIIILREAMEGEHHRDRQVAGPLLDRTCLHSWMNSHSPTTQMSLRISLISMSGSTTRSAHQFKDKSHWISFVD
jgi:hypothetical protein